MEARAAELLPVEYFHLVFTLPDALNPIALANHRVVYDLLFAAAAETLLVVAANPEHLGARIGVLAVLHTWGQTLQFHPHVHCVVPGGGLSAGSARAGSARARLLPAGAGLEPGVPRQVPGGPARRPRRRPTAPDGPVPRGRAIEFERLVSAAVRSDWVVYAKPPFGGPEVVLKYLARYTHRVAISDGRLLDFEDGIVRFRYKDYAHGNRKRVMKLSASEFVRRFLLHVLPAGFVRIRHYGILSNRHRQEDLALCREWLGGGTAAAEPEETVKVPEARRTRSPRPGSVRIAARAG